MTDSNTPDPTPRFGEFASPEEQRSRIQQPEFETLPPAPGTVPPAPAPSARGRCWRPSCATRTSPRWPT